jgi:hypothetical protein
MEEKKPRVQRFGMFWGSMKIQVCGGMCENE